MPGFIIGGNEATTEGVPRNTVETHRQHRWRIIKLGPIDFSSDFLIAQSFQLPNVNIEVQEIKAALLTYKFAKAVNWDNASVTFYDALPTLDRLEVLWRNKVYSNEDGIKSHKDYKFDTIIELLDGAGEPTIKFILKNSWPSKISHGPLSYASTEIKVITVDLVYDFAEIERVSAA